jgi:putative ABC transport system ATP-binding protein
VIELMGIRKVYNAGKPNEFVAVDNVSLSLDVRETTMLKGPSGSGKTTLLGILGCMTRPTSGRITLLDREITSLPGRFLTDIRRKHFGFVFQQFNLVKGISVLENVMLPAYPTGEKRSQLHGRAADLLQMLNLSGKASFKVEWLSGGEAQRVAIARALINDPPIIIADEPTAHLDTKLSKDFINIMSRLKASGKGIIIASHDPIVYESEVVDRLVEMRDGRTVHAGASL